MLNISAKLKNSYVLEQEDQSLTRSASLNTPNENRPDGSAFAVKLKRFNSDEEHPNIRIKRMLSTNIEKYSHLLIAKIKDTQIMFSFFVEAALIDAPASSAGAF